MSEPTRTSVAQLFDALANEYDEMRRDLGWDPFPHLDELIRLRGRPRFDEERILDLGSGTGELAARLVQLGATLIGVDVSVDMCEMAAERVPGTPFFPIDVADGLPFDDHSYDVVLSLSCLEYVEDIAYALDELLRTLRAGGWMLFLLELCEAEAPGGCAPEVEFLDEWRRYRWTWEQVETWARQHLLEPQLARTDGYLLDSGERTRYARVIGRKP